MEQEGNIANRASGCLSIDPGVYTLKSMLQHTKNDYTVKIVTNPVRSNLFRGVLRWLEGAIRQQDANEGIGEFPTALDLSV